MPDDMLMSPDGKSLRRGRRRAQRHQMERAAHVWRPGEEESPVVAIASDISTDGVGIHTRVRFDVGDEIMVDIKRGKEIDGATFIYLRGRVTRVEPAGDDHFMVGVQIISLERKYP